LSIGLDFTLRYSDWNRLEIRVEIDFLRQVVPDVLIEEHHQVSAYYICKADCKTYFHCCLSCQFWFFVVRRRIPFRRCLLSPAVTNTSVVPTNRLRILTAVRRRTTVAAVTGSVSRKLKSRPGTRDGLVRDSILNWARNSNF